MDSKDQKHNVQQRLLISSALLTFLYYAEAKIQGVSLVGATIQFRNEDAIQDFLWAIWAYYYLRSYQYYRHTGIDTFEVALNASYLDEIGHKLLSLTRSEFKLIPEDDGIKSSKVRIGFGKLPSETPIERRGGNLVLSIAIGFARLFDFIRYGRSAQLRAADGYMRFNFFRPFGKGGSSLRRKFGWVTGPSEPRHNFRFGFRAVVYPPSNRFELQGQTKYYVQLPVITALRVLYIHAKAALLRPEFMENHAPLVLGLAPVWFAVAASRSNIASTFKDVWTQILNAF